MTKMIPRRLLLAALLGMFASMGAAQNARAQVLQDPVATSLQTCIDAIPVDDSTAASYCLSVYGNG